MIDEFMSILVNLSRKTFSGNDSSRSNSNLRNLSGEIPRNPRVRIRLGMGTLIDEIYLVNISEGREIIIMKGIGSVLYLCIFFGGITYRFCFRFSGVIGSHTGAGGLRSVDLISIGGAV